MKDFSHISPAKWRPTLGLVVVLMLFFVLVLPLGGLWIFRFYDNQLVRETENELIAQAAFVQAIMRQKLRNADFDISDLNTIIRTKTSDYREQVGLQAQLDLSSNSILPPRAEAKSVILKTNPILFDIGRDVGEITREVQEITLAGFRLLDSNGIVIAGREEIGFSLAHVQEVAVALSGNYSSQIRQRVSKSPRPPIYSISRGTDIRVFVAMPIDYQGKVVGVAYLSRTPSHFLRELFGQRWKLAAAALFLLIITTMIAILFVRTVKGPIDALNQRTKRLSDGDRSAITPLRRHGTREVAQLADGIFSMSKKLFDRSDYIRNFASHVSHELKSPITSIQGAAELLSDSKDSLSEDQKSKLLSNISKDTDRMTVLLTRLRELAATEVRVEGKSSTVWDVLAYHAKEHRSINLLSTTSQKITLDIPDESLNIVIGNLVDNSLRHNATRIDISVYEMQNGLAKIRIQDNGDGVSERNRNKVLELFFTTRRESGGTGMGLNIVQSILTAHDGKIALSESTNGACFEITMPMKNRNI